MEIATQGAHFSRHGVGRVGSSLCLHCAGFLFWQAKAHSGPEAPFEGSSIYHRVALRRVSFSFAAQGR